MLRLARSMELTVTLKAPLVRPAASHTKVSRRNHRRQVKDWITVDDIGRAERFQTGTTRYDGSGGMYARTSVRSSVLQG